MKSFEKEAQNLILKAIKTGTSIEELGHGIKNEQDRSEIIKCARTKIANIGGFEINQKSKQNPTPKKLNEMQSREKIEKIGSILGSLKMRFDYYSNLHDGIQWEDIYAALSEDEKALESLSQMQSAGHEPNVYHEDDKYYYIGTCSFDIPPSTINCVYDKEGANQIRKNNPQDEFNGSAVEMAENMGISLMPREHYRILQKKAHFDKNSKCWLLVDPSIRSEGTVMAFDIDSHTRLYIDDHYNHVGWRGTLKIKKVLN